MKKDEVAIGRTYLAKVSDKVVPVRIDAEHPRQGWFATNQVTGKRVHIKSAQRLRREVGRNGTQQRTDAPPESTPADAPVAETTSAIAADPNATPATDRPVPTPEATPSPEPDPAPAPRTASYDERLMFSGTTDPAAAREAWANHTPSGNLENPMSTKKTTKTAKNGTTKAPDAAKAKKADKPKAEPKDMKMSALDAAAKVMHESGTPMTTGEMIEQMAKKGYWSSPGGKTPAATLYSAILREINVKGKESRFEKTERGKFARTDAE